MEITSVLFYTFSVLAIVGALIILFTKNVLYAAFSLVIIFLAIAVIYVLSAAEFVAVTQIMIYVGGIVVLLIFGIMLTNKLSGRSLVSTGHNKFVGLLITGLMFSLLMAVILKTNFTMISRPLNENTITKLGVGFMSDYLLPFEVAAVLLLIALIGAVSIASNKNESKD